MRVGLSKLSHKTITNFDHIMSHRQTPIEPQDHNFDTISSKLVTSAFKTD